jgi:F-type H+-transporting ATPase subunit a
MDRNNRPQLTIPFEEYNPSLMPGDPELLTPESEEELRFRMWTYHDAQQACRADIEAEESNYRVDLENHPEYTEEEKEAKKEAHEYIMDELNQKETDLWYAANRIEDKFDHGSHDGSPEAISPDQDNDEPSSPEPSSANTSSVESISPLDQFEIRDLISIDVLDYFHISLSNIGLYLLISFILIKNFNILCLLNKYTINRWTISLETIYTTVYSIVVNQINEIKGQIYFPFIFGLFMFILTNNLVGMIPYSFASTGHFILAFSLSFTVVLGATILGFYQYTLIFFSILVPSGCPLPLVPLLVLIEFVSYLARNVSLGLRLAANILSGHMLLNILSGFTFNIMKIGLFYFILGLLPLSFIIAFSGLELAIAFIQAQVFVVLTCSYIKDGLDLH